MTTPNIQQIAAYEVAKHAAEKNAHGVEGAIMGQNHGHTGGDDGAQIQHSALIGVDGDGSYHLSADQRAGLVGGEATDLHTHLHNGLPDIEGGEVSTFVQDGLFQAGLAQSPISYFYHVGRSEKEELERQKAILSTAISATLTDQIKTCVVTASGKTITLPKARTERIGKDWTVLLSSDGYADIVAASGDNLPTNDSIFRLDNIGASITFRCLSVNSWGIV